MTIRSLADLRAAIAIRRKKLGLSQLALDDAAGLQSGYTGKLECGAKGFGDMSLAAVLAALGVELTLMLAASKHPNSPSNSKAYAIIRKKIAEKGGRALAFKMSEKSLRSRARQAANARWARVRRIKSAEARSANQTSDAGRGPPPRKPGGSDAT